MAQDTDNGILKQWTAEAKQEVAEMGWRDASHNALMLLCNDMGRKRDEQIGKLLRGPARFFVGSLSTGLLWWIIRDVILHL